ncbi:MAG TPA: TrmH family RNA methyltransferase [Candidatus Doudnabacteria bacterium]|nr:TrmH family RNA methyltransferase [Candidatus Doudnabacteria bacterium]
MKKTTVIPETTNVAKRDAGYTESITLIAHNIRSLHNVGAIFRTADSFGVEKIYLTGYTGTPEGKNADKISKVALGAEQFVEWDKSKSLVRVVKKLKAEGVRIVVLENNVKFKTTRLQDYKPKFPLALILGEETKGNTKKILDLADDILEIPMHGRKESLNVSVACGVALYGIRAK